MYYQESFNIISHKRHYAKVLREILALILDKQISQRCEQAALYYAIISACQAGELDPDCLTLDTIHLAKMINPDRRVSIPNLPEINRQYRLYLATSCSRNELHTPSNAEIINALQISAENQKKLHELMIPDNPSNWNLLGNEALVKRRKEDLSYIEGDFKKMVKLHNMGYTNEEIVKTFERKVPAEKVIGFLRRYFG